MKAVLVIDTPKNCSECKLMYLQGIGESICNAVDWEERPSWCPLKDLPQKIEGKREKFMPTYSLGWNDCLDAIELGLKPLWEITE